MRTRFDHAAKQIIGKTLESAGLFLPEEEVSPDPQRFDGRFIPDPARAPQRHHRTLLDRLATRPCCFEAFHLPPDTAELSECARKLLNLRHVLSRTGPPPPLPYLWVISAGRPVAGLAALRCRPLRGWVHGIYDAAPVLHLGIVVVRDLPATRSTLLLRLLGAGRVLRQAIAELKALPDDARERRIALPILVRCRLEVPEDPTQRTVDDEEFLMSTQDILEVWERKVEHRGRQEGRKEGMQRSLIGAYQARFGAIPNDLRAAIEQTDEEATLEGWLKVIVARSADEIAAALLKP